MLDDYKEKQSIVYGILMNEINSDHLSHAYLFDENNNSDAYGLVMAFVKEILCKNVNEKENICKRIDDGNYPEIKLIEPDGMLIKKQQIIDLQHEFSMKATEGNRRIYIIRDCEKMRPETANSMLKFLEEPDNNLIAILMTNNFNNLLSTIVSRCQLIRLNNNGNGLQDNDLTNMSLNFIMSIENNGIKTILKTQDLLFDTISVKDRDGITKFFDKLIDIYYDIMKIDFDEIKSKYGSNYDKLLQVNKNNSNIDIMKKIDFILELKDRIKYNVNCNLLIDSLIVNIGG